MNRLQPVRAASAPAGDAAAVRAHLLHLHAAGASYRSIARAAGTGKTTVHAIASGRARVSAAVAAALLALTPSDLKLPADANGVRWRLRALYVMGHGPARIARAAGCHRQTITSIAGGRTTAISPQLRRRLIAVYDSWWDKRAPERTRVEQAAAAAARNRARREGWCAGAALDETLLDTPGYQPRSRYQPAVGTGIASDYPLGHPQAPVSSTAAERPLGITTGNRSRGGERMNTGSPRPGGVPETRQQLKKEATEMSDNTLEPIIKGLTAQEAARLLTVLDQAQKAEWRATREVAWHGAEHESRFQAASELTGTFLDTMAETLDTGLRQPAEDVQAFAHRADAQAECANCGQPGARETVLTGERVDRFCGPCFAGFDWRDYERDQVTGAYLPLSASRVPESEAEADGLAGQQRELRELEQARNTGIREAGRSAGAPAAELTRYLRPEGLPPVERATGPAHPDPDLSGRGWRELRPGSGFYVRQPEPDSGLEAGA